MRSLLRGTLLFGMLGLAAVRLSGCLSVDLTTTVTPQGRFTGEMQLMLDKRQLQAFGMSSLGDVQGQLGDEQSDNPRVQVTWSETDEQYIQTVSFTDATAQEIDAAASSGASPTSTEGGVSAGSSVSFPLAAEVRGDRMVVTMAQDSAGSGSASQELNDPQVRALLETAFANARISVTITMPGDIENVTGLWPDGAKDNPGIVAEQPDPATYEISAPLLAVVDLAEQSPSGHALEITSDITEGAVAPADPQPGAGGSSGSMVVPILIGVGVVLLALIALGLLLARLRQPGTEPARGPADDAMPPAPDAGAESRAPGVPEAAAAEAAEGAPPAEPSRQSAVPEPPPPLPPPRSGSALAAPSDPNVPPPDPEDPRRPDSEPTG